MTHEENVKVARTFWAAYGGTTTTVAKTEAQTQTQTQGHQIEREANVILLRPS